MADGQKSAASAGDVNAQLKTIREDVAKLAELMRDLAGQKADEAKRAAGEEAEKLAGRSRQAAEAAAERARQAAGSVEDYIAEKPVQSALIALLVGVFIGSLSRR